MINIRDLKKLSVLDCKHNILSSLPESIGDLESLTRLEVSNNHLTDIPDSFTKFKNIDFLNLKENNLENAVNSAAQSGLVPLIKFLLIRMENEEFDRAKAAKLGK